MKKLYIMLLFATCNSYAEESWLDINTTSYHFSDQKFNQDNYGLGFEHHFNSNWSILAGHYQNSMDYGSSYILGAWTPVHYKFISAGLATGMVNGYPALNNRHIGPVVAGLLRVEGESIGANIFVMPKAKESPWTVGLQFKYKF